MRGTTYLFCIFCTNFDVKNYNQKWKYTKKPKPKNEGLFAHGLGIKIVLQGFMFGILALTAFKIGESVTGTLAGGQALAFMTLALSQTIQAFNMRSEKSIFKIGMFSNKTLTKLYISTPYRKCQYKISTLFARVLILL